MVLEKLLARVQGLSGQPGDSYRWSWQAGPSCSPPLAHRALQDLAQGAGAEGTTEQIHDTTSHLTLPR